MAKITVNKGLLGQLLTTVKNEVDSQSTQTVSDTDSIRLVSAMNSDVTVRDAFIMAVISPELDVDELVGFATDPHSENSKTVMSDTLDGFFKHGDPSYAKRGAILMENIITQNTGGKLDTIHAVAGCLRWAAGDDEQALDHARMVPEDHESYHLAGITIMAILQNLHPCVKETV